MNRNSFLQHTQKSTFLLTSQSFIYYNAVLILNMEINEMSHTILKIGFLNDFIKCMILSVVKVQLKEFICWCIYMDDISVMIMVISPSTMIIPSQHGPTIDHFQELIYSKRLLVVYHEMIRGCTILHMFTQLQKMGRQCRDLKLNPALLKGKPRKWGGGGDDGGGPIQNVLTSTNLNAPGRNNIHFFGGHKYVVSAKCETWGMQCWGIQKIRGVKDYQ